MAKKRKPIPLANFEEERAERLVPAAQRLPVVEIGADGKTAIIRPATAERGQWDDPDDINDRAKNPRQVIGYRRADPLLRMHNADGGKTITKAHLQAAERLAIDYERGVEGAISSGSPKERVDNEQGGDALDGQLQAISRYRDACDAMGPSLRGIVQLAALHKWTIPKIAELIRLPEHRASGLLMAGLDRLADFYFPTRSTRAALIERAIIVDQKITDIPQNRLGRIPRA